MTNNLCPKAWTELAISPTGLFTPCCVFEEPLKKENGEYFKAHVDSFGDVWNSGAMREIRKKMLSGEEVPGCRQCIVQENRENKSKRLESISELNDLGVEIEYKDHSDGELAQKPISMDLKLGNTCNLSCRMCQPKDSNIVEKNFRKITDKEDSFKFFQNAISFDLHLNQEIKDIENWASSENFINQMKENSTDIINLNVAGGEPLIQKEFKQLLDVLLGSGSAKKCRMFISTNLTVLPKAIVEKLKQFKSVHFGVSMDGVGEVQEYIRYPIKWKKFEKNLIELAKIQEKQESFFTSICVTVQIYNIANISKILDYYRELLVKYFKSENLGIYFHILTYPNHLKLSILPPKMKEIMAQMINDSRYFYPEIKYDDYIQSEIEKLIGALEATVELDINQLKLFKKYTSILDKQNKSSFKDVSPYLARLINEELAMYDENYLEDISVIASYAWAHQDRGELEQARVLFQRILNQKESSSVLRGLAHNFYLENDYDSAINTYLRLKESNNLDLSGVKTLGWIYKEINRYKEALELFKQAKDMAPTDPDATSEINWLEKNLGV